MLPSALGQVQEITTRGDQLAVFLDYDGTLTPIVGRPNQAELGRVHSGNSAHALGEIAGRNP